MKYISEAIFTVIESRTADLGMACFVSPVFGELRTTQVQLAHVGV